MVAGPNRIFRPGDDRPVAGLYHFVWRMSGWRQTVTILLSLVVAFMSGFHRLAEPSRELIAYYRLAAQTAIQHDLMARWMTRSGDIGEAALRTSRTEQG